MDKRHQIIHEATKLFLTQGFAGVSMSDIVKASNVSKGGIYNYYGSKEDLFIDVAHTLIDAIVHLRQTKLLGRTYDSLKEFLTAYVDFIFLELENREEDQIGNMFMLCYDASQISEELTEKLRKVNKETVEIFIERLNTAKTTGEIVESTDSHTIAEMLFSLKEGVCVDNIIRLYDRKKAKKLLNAQYGLIYKLIER
jgi:AcrR family transcriptional regulator